MAPKTNTAALSLLAIFSSALAAPSAVLNRRFELNCNDNGGYYRPIAEVQSCVTYLNSLGDQKCTVDDGNVSFCVSGDTNVSGSNIGSGSTSSLCTDVAKAVQNIIDSCTSPEGYVGGAAAASGNGDLIVNINAG
ncbi:hypothetical protein BJX99DRAFT_228684 [Aspergillus californicus]